LEPHGGLEPGLRAPARVLRAIRRAITSELPTKRWDEPEWRVETPPRTSLVQTRDACVRLAAEASQAFRRDQRTRVTVEGGLPGGSRLVESALAFVEQRQVHERIGIRVVEFSGAS
jgi:hypothetical protein